jgi:predicted nucleic acid-binding protein
LKSSEEAVVVADANVLLSGLAGRATEKVFFQPITIYTTEFTVKEVEKYLPRFCERYGAPMKDVLEELENLEVLVKGKRFYKEKLPEAEKLIGQRDPYDVDVLALALKLDVPIWSNDNDFKDMPVPRYTTAQLLRRLGV